jgi:hypothetical protein
LPAERFDLLKRAIPSHGLLPRPVDLFEQRTPRMWLLEDTRRELPFYVVGVFNWDAGRQIHLDETFARTGLPAAERYVTFDFWDNKFGMLEGDALHATLEPASCRILAVRPMADRPQLISTSRHITQGVVDVVEEAWDVREKKLRGVSRVVGGDPYELRVAKPASREWKLLSTIVTGAERATVQIVGEEVLGWRVRIDSPESGKLNWQLSFQ